MRVSRQGLRVLLVATFAGAAAGCTSESPPVDEMLTTRTQGLVYLRRDQLPEAEAQFKKLVALAPKEPLGHADLGLTYLRGGRFAEAEAELRRARNSPADAPGIHGRVDDR